MAARLLFGQPIFICEGWSLDSTSFLIVAGEILAAVDALSDAPERPIGIDTYAPFRIGMTRPGTYLTCYADYLARDDCHWSGIPAFRDDPDVRGRLHEELRRLDMEAISAGRIGEIFGRHLGNRQVGKAIGRIAAYAQEGSGLRIARGQISPTSYLETVRPLFEEVGHCVQQLGKGIWHQEILSVLELMRRDASRMTSSSVVMAGARGIVSDDLYPTVEHASRLAYMDVHSRHEGASFSAPALTGHAPDILRTVDGHLARQRAGLPGALEFSTEGGDAESLLAQLGQLKSWRPVWESIVSLSLHEDWQRAVAALRAEAPGEPLDEALRGGSFGKLEKLLATHCPDLILKKSVGERWGLGFKIMGRRIPKGTDRAVDTVIHTALLTLPLLFIVPAPLAGAAAYAAADKLGDKWLSGVKLLSRQTTGSSLLRVIRR